MGSRNGFKAVQLADCVENDLVGIIQDILNFVRIPRHGIGVGFTGKFITAQFDFEQRR